MSTYSTAQVAALEAQSVWTYAEAVAFAESEGLKPRSVISKIKHLGLTYETKPVAVSKTGEPVIRKAEFVESIQRAVGLALPSLAKATKQDLALLAAALQASES